MKNTFPNILREDQNVKKSKQEFTWVFVWRGPIRGTHPNASSFPSSPLPPLFAENGFRLDGRTDSP